MHINTLSLSLTDDHLMLHNSIHCSLSHHRSNFLGDGGCMLHSQAVETLYKAMLARLEVRTKGGRGEWMLPSANTLLNITLDFFL